MVKVTYSVSFTCIYSYSDVVLHCAVSFVLPGLRGVDAPPSDAACEETAEDNTSTHRKHSVTHVCYSYVILFGKV